MTVHQKQGRRKGGWMLYKVRYGVYHPYIYTERRSAEKQLGWFGDEIHRVRIMKVKELAK